MASQLASLSKSAIRRIITALADRKSGNEVIGSLGALGGFQVNGSAVVTTTTGDIAVLPSPGNLGAYRVVFPNMNANITGITWFDVKGFTPRSPGTAETADARVTGYAQDATTNQWYITIQIVSLSSNALLPTPPAGFVIGVRAAFSLASNANAL